MAIQTDDLIESHVDGQDPAQRGAYRDITKPDGRAGYEGIPHCLAVCVYARFTDHDDQRDDKKLMRKPKVIFSAWHLLTIDQNNLNFFIL